MEPSHPSVWHLTLFFFFAVSGGPFGVEEAVAAAGPAPCLIGFALLPILWGLPQALMTAELSSMFDARNGGYIVWVRVQRAAHPMLFLLLVFLLALSRSRSPSLRASQFLSGAKDDTFYWSCRT